MEKVKQVIVMRKDLNMRNYNIEICEHEKLKERS